MRLTRPSPIPPDWSKEQSCERCAAIYQLAITDVRRVSLLYRLWNHLPPKTGDDYYWVCPHCGRRNYLGRHLDGEIATARAIHRTAQRHAADHATPTELVASVDDPKGAPHA